MAYVLCFERKVLEARTGFEPVNKGFADLESTNGKRLITNYVYAENCIGGPLPGQLVYANAI